MMHDKTNTIEHLQALFSKGAELYDSATSDKPSSQQMACLKLLKEEKTRALALLTPDDDDTQDSGLTEPLNERLQAILSNYSTHDKIDGFIELEQQLLTCLNDSLSSLKPSGLSLKLRQITNRHQQCLEKLTALLNK
ncbi:hypothetical protein [Alteromonas gilva]|uniref:DUF2383 domain-containing protein n=1 Tax=Alteromonas gilva TaxID=2987522 RepID=A0ABT5L0Z8_9ALTE|nr:hypothetical protein [Alteromonas gilva]MDC8830699.1 hypothetical protein [Alteromonas gilva]